MKLKPLSQSRDHCHTHDPAFLPSLRFNRNSYEEGEEEEKKNDGSWMCLLDSTDKSINPSLPIPAAQDV